MNIKEQLEDLERRFLLVKQAIDNDGKNLKQDISQEVKDIERAIKDAPAAIRDAEMIIKDIDSCLERNKSNMLGK